MSDILSQDEVDALLNASYDDDDDSIFSNVWRS